MLEKSVWLVSYPICITKPYRKISHTIQFFFPVMGVLQKSCDIQAVIRIEVSPTSSNTGVQVKINARL